MRLPAFTLITLLAFGAPALAQDPPPPDQQPAGAVPQPAARQNGVKYHLSFAASGGVDLDLFGNLVMPALGEHNGTQVAVRQPRTWPDFYVDVPKRPQVTIGFGLLRKGELLARFSKVTYAGEPYVDAGNLAGPEGNQTLILSLSDYRERSWEIGWRHYKMLAPRYKQYAQVLIGRRLIEPLRGNFSALETLRSLAILRLYDRATLTTVSIEVGITLEWRRFGVFTEAGARWQHQLKRDDSDLVGWSFEPVNNTPPRVYLPLQFGVLIRM